MEYGPHGFAFWPLDTIGELFHVGFVCFDVFVNISKTLNKAPIRKPDSKYDPTDSTDKCENEFRYAHQKRIKPLSDDVFGISGVIVHRTSHGAPS